MNKLPLLSSIICIISLSATISDDALATETLQTAAETHCQALMTELEVSIEQSAETIKECLATVEKEANLNRQLLATKSPTKMLEQQDTTSLPAIKTATPKSAEGASGER